MVWRTRKAKAASESGAALLTAIAAGLLLGLLLFRAGSAAARAPAIPTPAELGPGVEKTVDAVRLPEVSSPTPPPIPQPPASPPIDPSAAEPPAPIPQPKSVEPPLPKPPPVDLDVGPPSQGAADPVRDAGGAAGGLVGGDRSAPQPAPTSGPAPAASFGSAPAGDPSAAAAADGFSAPLQNARRGTDTAAGRARAGQPQAVPMTPLPRWLARVWPAVALGGTADRVLTGLLDDFSRPLVALAGAIPGFLAPGGEEAVASASPPAGPPPPPADPAEAPQASIFDVPAEGKSVLLALAIALLALDGLVVLVRLWVRRDRPWHRRWRRRQGF